MSSIEDMQARLRERGRVAIAERESERDRNAREMPESARIFRMFRAVFGDGGCYRMRENGRELVYGTPQPEKRHPPVISVSMLAAGMKDGSIQPSGEVRVKQRKPQWEQE